MDGAMERWEEESGGGIERVREGSREDVRMGGRDTSRELSSEGHGIQYIHKPSHNAARAIETLVLQMKNSEQVYIINSVL